MINDLPASQPKNSFYSKIKYAIVTIVSGHEGSTLQRISGKLIEDYAQSIDADLIVLRPKFQHFHNIIFYEKLQIYSLLDIYDRILYLDSDILVLPDAPNLFNIVPLDTFGACLMHKYTDYHQYAIHEIQNVLGNICWQADDNYYGRMPYFNAGVMLISKFHQSILNPFDEKLSSWIKHDQHTYFMADQTYLNYKLNEIGASICDIHFKFNHTNALDANTNRFRSYFIHYAGCSHQNPKSLLKCKKLKKMSIDSLLTSNPWLFNILKKYNFMRQLVDLLF